MSALYAMFVVQSTITFRGENQNYTNVDRRGLNVHIWSQVYLKPQVHVYDACFEMGIVVLKRNFF